MDRCEGCGLAIAGGAAACQKLFDEFALPRPGMDQSMRRLMVDIYCLQHPDRYCISGKSLAAHLTGLAWIMEFGGGTKGLDRLRVWLDGPKHLVKPSPPAERGRLTVLDAQERARSNDMAYAVHAWATSTWDAYCDLHDVAREWIQDAMAMTRI